MDISVKVTPRMMDGRKVHQLELDGKILFLSKEIARVLGYGGTGDKLQRNILKRWKEEFEEGKDFIQIRDPVLDQLRGLIPALRRTRAPMLLSTSGIFKVLDHVAFSSAEPMQRFLLQVVEPAVADKWKVSNAKLEEIGARQGSAEMPPIMRFFAYDHLPPHLQMVSAVFFDAATRALELTLAGPEQSTALRKLLEAKDCAVRAAL